MEERKPISIGYHPYGLIFMPLLGLLFAFLGRAPERDCLLAALWVVPWHLLQFLLDYRHSEKWYYAFTAPPYRPRPREAFALRWPALVALLPAFVLGVVAVGSVWIACLAFYYPWQSSLYYRSQREFGGKSGHSFTPSA